MNTNEISWGNIDSIEDYFITYLLYKEGKTVDNIVRIRNLSREKVEKDIIDAKIWLHNTIKSVNKVDKSTLYRLLELPKNERKDYINKISNTSKEDLLIEIFDKYNIISNPDDKMLLIWIIGELKADKLIGLLCKDIVHNNGNVRRMVCSALGKIENEKSIKILHRALNDKKPQVRQYAAKALKNIGNEETIELLEKIINRRYEKNYVKRTCIDVAKYIEERLKISI